MQEQTVDAVSQENDVGQELKNESSPSGVSHCDNGCNDQFPAENDLMDAGVTQELSQNDGMKVHKRKRAVGSGKTKKSGRKSSKCDVTSQIA